MTIDIWYLFVYLADTAGESRSLHWDISTEENLFVSVVDATEERVYNISASAAGEQ